MKFAAQASPARNDFFATLLAKNAIGGPLLRASSDGRAANHAFTWDLS